jgi:PAS domain S-box-containing protein
LIPADGLAVWLLDPGRMEWRVAVSHGLSPEFSSLVQRGRSEDMPPVPLCAEDVQNTPMLRDRALLYRREGIRSLMAVPIFIRAERRGSLVFYFHSLHHFSESEVALGNSIGSLSSSALAATELYREQTIAKTRSDFLADASAILASSLNYEETLAAVANLAVPHFADGCAVDLIEEDGIRRVAVAHQDPEKARLIWDIARRFPQSVRPETGLGRVLASGRAELYEAVSDAELQRDARNAEHLAVLRQLKIRSVLLVPMLHRDEVLGVITLATAESGRTFTEADRALAEAIASRAGVAIENARLFTALRASERNFRAVSDTASCAIFIHNGAQVVYANSAATDLIGMQTGETNKMWDRIHPADRELVVSRARARLRGEVVPSRYEFRVLKPDGQMVWLDLSAATIQYGGSTAVLATAFDVTERRFAVEQLERREQEARALLNNLPDTISRFDRSLRYLYISPNVQRLTGVEPEMCIGKTFEELGYPVRLCELWNNSLRRVFESGQPETIEFSITSPDGQLRHLISTGVPEVTRAGVVESVMTISRDVTEQRATIQDLRRSQTQLRLIIDSIPALVAYVDRDERLRRVNRSFEEWFNAPLKSFLGKTVREVVGDLNYEHLEPQIKRALTGVEVQYEATNHYADGVRHVLITYVPDFDDENQVRGFITLVVDLTERRKAEDALRKTEKLAAAGRLAASIAHEINNPLESVTNLLYLLQQEAQLTDLGREYLGLAEQELSRVSQIATQTLRFHRQSTKASLTRVEDVLDAVATLYRSRLSRLVARLETRYRNSSPILAFDGELRQLFANLVSNALDALPNEGRLLVRTRPAVGSSGVRGVIVTVADTGQGIAPELLGRIFEPFVTSKGNTGTGLGLWVSKEIVQKHGGTMRMRSRTAAPSGTVFRVFLSDVPSIAPATED